MEGELEFFYHRLKETPTKLKELLIGAAVWHHDTQSLDLRIHNTDLAFDAPVTVTIQFKPDANHPTCVPASGSGTALSVPCHTVTQLFARGGPGVSLLARVAVVLKSVYEARNSVWPTDRPAFSVRSVMASNVLRELHTASSVDGLAGLDMSVLLLSGALLNVRRATVCSPVPYEFVSAATQSPQFDRLKAGLDCLPSVNTLQSHHTSVQPQEVLPLLSDDALRLLHFLLVTAPVTLRAVAPTDRMVPVSSPRRPWMELEVVGHRDPLFDREVRQHGKMVAFHGSSTDNFHSVLMNGLQNLSGTRRERSGAIFGDGIYLAQDLRVATNFSQASGYCWGKARALTPTPSPSTFSSTSPSATPSASASVDLSRAFSPVEAVRCPLSCVVACEVVNTPDNAVLGTVKKPSSLSAKAGPGGGATPSPNTSGGEDEGRYYVVKDPRHVRITRLLVYRSEGGVGTGAGSGAGSGSGVSKSGGGGGGGVGTGVQTAKSSSGVWTWVVVAVAVGLLWLWWTTVSSRRSRFSIK